MPSTPLPTNDLARIQQQLAAQTEQAMGEYAACVAKAILDPRRRNEAAEQACAQRLADVLAVLAAASDVVGRARALQEAA